MSEWIEWKGGACPVDDDVKVQVKLRSGETSAETWRVSAEEWEWQWVENARDGDIIAYRVTP